jgi:hypothetical protein
MLLKILIVGALAVALMAAIRDGRILRDAGLLSECHAASFNGKTEPLVQNCSKGRLDGFPDLTNKACKLVSVQGQHEYWRCDVPLVSSEAPSG